MRRFHDGDVLTDWEKHMLISVALATCLMVAIGALEANTVLFVSAAALGALLPDLDHTESRGTKWMHSIALAMIAVIVFGYLGFSIDTVSIVPFVATGLIFGAFCVAYRMFKPHHRGILHSWLYAIVLTAGAYILTQDFYISTGIGFGVIAHLIGDGIFIKLV